MATALSCVVFVRLVSYCVLDIIPPKEHAQNGVRRGLFLVSIGGARRTLCAPERNMSKEDSIEVTGTIVEKFPSGLFSVQLDQERVVLAHLAGKLRRNRIRVLAGDRVTLEMSPYDLTKGRITYRHK